MDVVYEGLGGVRVVRMWKTATGFLSEVASLSGRQSAGTRRWSMPS